MQILELKGLIHDKYTVRTHLSGTQSYVVLS